MAGGVRPDRSRLRPEIRAFLDGLDDGPRADYATLDPAVERVQSEVRLRDLGGEPEPVDGVEELSFASDGASIPVRLYRPAADAGTILFIHGGGWVVGSRDTHDISCRILANRSRCAVVSVEYRKAPEHPFPAAVRDCDAALDWLLEASSRLGLDVRRLVVAGESAGGNLAAVLAIHARDRAIALAGQVLIYPVIATDMARQSYRDFADGFYLGAEAMRWFIRHYAGAGDLDHPDIVPLNAPDLSGLAPAFIATVDHDPLRDEGRAYAAALVAAGNDVDFREVEGAVHGLWVMTAVTPAATELIAAAAAWIAAHR